MSDVYTLEDMGRMVDKIDHLKEALDQREEELRAARERIRLLEMQKGAGREALVDIYNMAQKVINAQDS